MVQKIVNTKRKGLRFELRISGQFLCKLHTAVIYYSNQRAMLIGVWGGPTIRTCCICGTWIVACCLRLTEKAEFTGRRPILAWVLVCWVGSGSEFLSWSDSISYSSKTTYLFLRKTKSRTSITPNSRTVTKTAPILTPTLIFIGHSVGTAQYVMPCYGVRQQPVQVLALQLIRRY